MQKDLSKVQGREVKIIAPKVQFKNLDLHEPSTIFEHANLEGSRFEHANLRGANFENANLKGASFRSANLNDVTEKGKRFSTNFKDSILDEADFTEALLSKESLAQAKVQPNTQLPKKFTALRSGYEYKGGEFNQGVKLTPRFAVKVMGSFAPPELNNAQIIKQRFDELETKNPTAAEQVRQMLTLYRGHFTPAQEPEKVYLVSDRAKGTPLSEVYKKLGKTDQDAIYAHARKQNEFLKNHLGFILGDRNQGNMFVEMENGKLKRDSEGNPLVQHIDYGIIHWG
ncbi:MAG: pentapeptide repeat-containing protein [Vampirovibrionales bacterium]